MSGFPGSPRPLKGAIISIDRFNPLASVIVFQYNPHTMTRKLKARTGGEKGSHSEALRLEGPPDETISVEVEIDATDQLEKKDPTATRLGIHPQLAALEMLLFPKSLQVIANTALAFAGATDFLPPQGPLTLFAWGIRRVLPVRLRGFTITEEAFDVNLNPIRARVSLDMEVLTYDKLAVTSRGSAVYLANQVMREAMATLSSIDNLTAVAGGDTRLL